MGLGSRMWQENRKSCLDKQSIEMYHTNMSTKMKIIVGVVILLVLGIGAFMFMGNSGKSLTQNNGMMGKSSSPFSSIQEALSKNLSLQCDVTDPQGHKTVSYIKNGKIRVDITGATTAENGSVIMRDNKMYFWNNKGGISMEFNIDELGKQGANSTPDQSGTGQNPQAYVDMMEKYKESCKNATVSDSLFEVPTNVKFQDFSEMMKMMQGGANGANSADYEKLMQQYSNPQ